MELRSLIALGNRWGNPPAPIFAHFSQLLMGSLPDCYGKRCEPLRWSCRSSLPQGPAFGAGHLAASHGRLTPRRRLQHPDPFEAHTVPLRKLDISSCWFPARPPCHRTHDAAKTRCNALQSASLRFESAAGRSRPGLLFPLDRVVAGIAGFLRCMADNPHRRNFHRHSP